VAGLHQAALQGNFYLFLPHLVDQMPDLQRRAMYFEWGGRQANNSLLPVRPAKSYVRWRRNVGVRSLAGMDNYIYMYRGLKLFDGSERDCYRAIKAGAITKEALDRYWGMTFPEDHIQMAKVLAGKLDGYTMGRDANTLGTTAKKFRVLFDGIVDRHVNYVWTDIVLNQGTIVDGAAQRIDAGPGAEGFTMPDWVIDELLRYTKNPGKRMKKPVKEWLLENSPKDYTQVTVYRGFGTQVDDWGDYSGVTMADVKKRLFRRTGVRDLTKLHVGDKIKVKRGKESSWSVSAQVATNFAAGQAKKSINWLVKAVVPASKVVIDFNELPRELRQKFPFHGQGEVIVDKGVHQGMVSMTWVDQGFETWLAEHGLVFKRQVGVVPA